MLLLAQVFFGTPCSWAASTVLVGILLKIQFADLVCDLLVLSDFLPDFLSEEPWIPYIVHFLFNICLLVVAHGRAFPLLVAQLCLQLNFYVIWLQDWRTLLFMLV